MSRVPDTTYRAAMQALVRFDERASLGQIDIPCLLLAGEDDRSAPPRVMQRMAEKMNNARVEDRRGHGASGQHGDARCLQPDRVGIPPGGTAMMMNDHQTGRT